MSTSNDILISLISSASSSPCHAGGDTVNSCQSRPSTKAVSSPLAQSALGESEPTTAIHSSPSGSSSTVTIQSGVGASVSVSSPTSSSASSFLAPVYESVCINESLESSGGSVGNAGKKPVWNKPSNGVLEIRPVMGAVSWPALSGSTKALSKSSESSKSSSDISLSASESQSTGSATVGSHKPSTLNSIANHMAPSHQQSMRLNHSNIFSNGGIPQEQVTAGQVVKRPPNKSFTKDSTQRSGSSSQSHSGTYHPQHQNSLRNRNGGPHLGEGYHHHSYGGRRDQDHGNHEWNAHHNHNDRYNHMQYHRLPGHFRGPTPPPHGSASFVSPPMRPYNPMLPDFGPVPLIYVPASQPSAFRMPFVAPMQSPYVSVVDPQLHSKIINQIDYYFSNENLIKDTYLRQNMDEQGWVSIRLVAGFRKVMQLTDNIHIILEALRMSTVVEIQGDKLRRRNDWMKWTLPSVQFPYVSSSQHQSSAQTLGEHGHDALAARVDGLTLEENGGHMSAQNNSQAPLSSDDRSV